MAGHSACTLVEAMDNRIECWIVAICPGYRRLQYFRSRDLAPRDQFGQAKGIVLRVLIWINCCHQCTLTR